MRLCGYVPDDASGQSGVTVAAGVDLGRLRQAEQHTLPAALVQLIGPYCGIKGLYASRFLKDHPLHISVPQARALMAVKASGFMDQIHRRYDPVAPVPFDRLPVGPATALVSLCWQYGNPWTDKNCGDAWQIACRADWHGFAGYLSNGFPDKRFRSRRRCEAAFVLAHLQPGIPEVCA